MKTKILLTGCFIILHSSFSLSSHAQGTEFTYQGRLNVGANPANGSYDLRFGIFDAFTVGTQQGSLLTNSSTTVSNGLFTVELDFGSQFSGADRWLEIAVRTNGTGAFTTLAPRQQITPAPYSITAKYLADVIANNTLTVGNYSTVGGGVANAATGIESSVGGGGENNAGGFGATISGGTQNNTFNNLATVGGGNLNVSSGYGATIGGGERNSSGGNWAFTGGGEWNLNSGDYCVIVGGISNQVLASVPNAFIGAGANNLSSGGNTVIGGGANNIVDNYAAVVGGGSDNHASGDRSVIAGGQTNVVSSAYAAVGGGWRNTIQGGSQASTISGGEINTIQGSASGIGGSTISGGWQNNIKTNSYFSTVSGGYFGLILSDAPYSVISGGTNNTIQTGASGGTISGGGGNSIQDYAVQSTIGGGLANLIQTNASYSTIGGGDDNVIQNGSTYSAIAGGQDNFIATNALYSTIGGGNGNAILPNASFATIPGGYANVAAGYYSFAAGQSALALNQGSFVWADSQFGPFSSTANDQFLVRAAGGVGINTANPMGNNLSVNGDTRLDAQALGYNEGLALNFPTNMSGSGGYGGIHFHSTARNGAFGASSIKWGMFYNYTPENGIAGNGLSLVQNNANTRFYISTNGNVGIGTLNPTNKLMVVNARCDGSSWINASDRNLKQGFAAVDVQAVLARVSALPVTTWSYKAQPEQRHLGPVAQDFHAAFDLGQDDTSISTVDESGVALAAVQGLNQKLEASSQHLEAENAELKQELAEMKQLVTQLAADSRSARLAGSSPK